MSGRLRTYFSAVYEIAGRYLRIGSLDEPVKEATLDGEHHSIEDRITVPPDSTRVAVNVLGGTRFSFLAIQVEGDGFLEVYWMVDTPEDEDSDPLPSGDNVRWRQRSLSCVAPMIMDTDEAVLHPTLSTEAADDGNGLPSLAGHAGALAARVYKVVLYNPHATEDVTARVTLIR